MSKWLVAVAVGLACYACTGDVEVHGVPKTIKVIWPDCEPGQRTLCTPVDAGGEDSGQ